MIFSELKRQMRQLVHNTFAVPALYTDATLVEWVAVNVRWHNRLIRQGDLESAGYAEVLDGVNRILFAHDELTRLALLPRSRGVITIPAYDNAQFTLESLEPADGPVDMIWNVSRVNP